MWHTTNPSLAWNARRRGFLLPPPSLPRPKHKQPPILATTTPPSLETRDGGVSHPPPPLPCSKREMEGFPATTTLPPSPETQTTAHFSHHDPSLAQNVRRRGFTPTTTPPLLKTQDGGVSHPPLPLLATTTPPSLETRDGGVACYHHPPSLHVVPLII